MIFLSTGGERHQTAANTALQFFEAGVHCVELSGGAYSDNCEEELASLPSEMILQVHNYFPPPKIPFVFNLASVNPVIASQSIEHVRSAIRLAVKLRRPIFSFHAGFRMDPSVDELGAQLVNKALLARDVALEMFGERIALLAEEARREGVTLLVENNVISQANFDAYNEDPLLLTDPDEIASFMKVAPSNLGLLIDVAHLKVSARTKSFDLVSGHEKLNKWIQGYHLSDNNGCADDNGPVSEVSWFWDHLVRGLNYYTLEVYSRSTSELIEQRNLVETMLASISKLETPDE